MNLRERKRQKEAETKELRFYDLNVRKVTGYDIDREIDWMTYFLF
jgi:hypothetical protein